MPRGYRHIKEYEREILELRAQGKSKREICEIYGLRLKQLTDFITRHNRAKRKLEAGITIKPKGRPRKDGTRLPPSVWTIVNKVDRKIRLKNKSFPLD